MNFKIYFISILSILAITTIQAQTRVSDTVSFDIYSGIERFSFTEKDSTRLRQGNYGFTSELMPLIENDKILIKELLINGNYLQNTKNGVWSYKYNSYLLYDLNIKRSWNATLQHNLNGVEDNFKIRYNEGNFNGSSTYSQRNITYGRFGNPNVLAEIKFENDTIIGEFQISIDGIEIKGKTDKNGFLNGVLILKYSFEGVSIIETRKYQNGFLLEIEKRNETTDEQLVKIIYDDVIRMLYQIENQIENLNFKVSDKFFGLKFNLGYQQSDKRIVEQKQGNKVIEKYIHLFDSIHNSHSVEVSKNSIIKFTSRFNYLYDFEEDSLVALFSNENIILNEKINETLNRPSVLLRKNNSDILFQQYQILKHIKSKSDTLQQVFDKITSGYFNYRSRNKYFSNGIPGLNESDTIVYFLSEDTLSLPFNFTQYITTSDSLIYQMGYYIEALKQKSNSTISKLNESLTIYENQEKIDSLDRVISSLESSIYKKYAETSNFVGEDLSKAPFSIKVFQSLNERFLSSLKNKYLKNSLPQEEMISMGNSLICFYTFLDSNKSFLDRVSNMQKHWNDSLFTIYRDNPFDFRKIETKILEGVQNASNILLRHYANQLLNAKTCEQINVELNKIIRLNKRVEFLVKNQELDNVQQLNKVLRRERVANRIERLLEL
jgi:regulator of RNase E activity RraB